MNNKYVGRKHRHTSAEIAQDVTTSSHQHVLPSLGFVTDKQSVPSYNNDGYWKKNVVILSGGTDWFY